MGLPLGDLSHSVYMFLSCLELLMALCWKSRGRTYELGNMAGVRPPLVHLRPNEIFGSFDGDDIFYCS